MEFLKYLYVSYTTKLKKINKSKQQQYYYHNKQKEWKLGEIYYSPLLEERKFWGKKSYL